MTKMSTELSLPGSSGLEFHRVAEILVTGGAGEGQRGSGYRVLADTVLTAAHVVDGATGVRVRFEADQPGEWSADVIDILEVPEIDIALLTISSRGEKLAPCLFGRIGDRDAVITCSAVGFPLWKLRDDPARHLADSPQSLFRDSCHIVGSAAILSNQREGTLEITVSPPDREHDRNPDPRASPWQGMSGAAIFCRGRIIGIITKHHRSDGLGRLAASRIDGWHFYIGGSELEQISTRLGMRDGLHGLADVVASPNEALIQAAYTAQIRDIAPTNLVGRREEISDLVTFCASNEAYGWWQGPPWVGKTALAAWFSLHPPVGVRIVSFFITGRLAGQADSVAFTEAMIDQLAVITGELVPATASLTAQDGLRRHLIEKAADLLRERGERLVLVVDGLDEDVGGHPGSGRPSIASLLPRHPPDGVHILVTSRRHPPLPGDVATDHPLRKCRQRVLRTVATAHDVEAEASYELRQRLHAVGDDREVIALITAAGGGLTAGELAELTNRLQLEIEDQLGSSFGRSLNSRQRSDSEDRVYLFAHETLRATADQILGVDLGPYRNRIHSWADCYRSQSWPNTTPRYLLQPYGRLLAQAGDLERLVAIATDQGRHDRMLLHTSANAAALTEIAAAVDLLLAETIPDLTGLVLLAAERERLSYPDDAVRANLRMAWTRLQHMWHESDLAIRLAEFPARAVRLAELNEIIGAVDPAQAAREAEQAALDNSDPSDRARAFAAIARSVGGSHPDRVARLADDAECAAGDITDSFYRDRALADIAQALAAGSLWDRAERAAGNITDSFYRDRALADISHALAARRLWDRAERAARDITDQGDQARALAAIVLSLGGSHPDRVTRLANDAEQAAGDITDPGDQVWAIVAIARGLAGSYPGRVARLADDAEHTARCIHDRGIRDRAYADIAPALAAAGHADRAIETVRHIYNSGIQQRAYVDIAQALAAAGHADRAIETVHYYVSDIYEHGIRSDAAYTPGFRDLAYADIGRVLAAAGNAEHAMETVHYIHDYRIQQRVYTEIAKALAGVGLWETARNAASKIAEPQHRVQALNEVAAALMKSVPSASETKNNDRRQLHLILGTALAGECWEESLAILGRVEPEAVIALHSRMIAVDEKTCRLQDGRLRRGHSYQRDNLVQFTHTFGFCGYGSSRAAVYGMVSSYPCYRCVAVVLLGSAAAYCAIELPLCCGGVPWLRSGTWSWRFPEWRLAARLVDDVVLAVKVVAEQPEQAFAVVEFDAEAFGFLAGGRGEARGGDDDSLGEFAL